MSDNETIDNTNTNENDPYILKPVFQDDLKETNGKDELGKSTRKPENGNNSASGKNTPIVENNADGEVAKITKIRIDDLVPYHGHDGSQSQTFGGVRLDDLVDSIKRIGLEKPIIVRSLNEGKYQILSGHNRVSATKTLGQSMIDAIIKDNLSEHEAEEVYFDSNLNQQSFKDWNYSQRLDAIRYTDKKIKEKSEQGKRSDLAGNKTAVQNRQKSKTSTTRDKMSVRLGIAPATFSKYRNIIKLDNEVLNALTKMLDSKKINLEIAYRISQLKPKEIDVLMNWLNTNPNVAFKGEDSNDAFKQLYAKSKDSQKPLTQKEIVAIIRPGD